MVTKLLEVAEGKQQLPSLEISTRALGPGRARMRSVRAILGRLSVVQQLLTLPQVHLRVPYARTTISVAARDALPAARRRVAARHDGKRVGVGRLRAGPEPA